MPLHVKLVVALLLSIAGTSRLPAALIVYEDFNYPAGSAANGLNGGVGWNGAWQTSPHFTAQGLDLTISAGDIPVNAPFANLVTSGNRLTTIKNQSSVTTGGNGSGIRTFRQIDLARLAGSGLLDPVSGKLGAPGTSIWIAFLARLAPGASNTNSGNGGIHLYDGLAPLTTSPYDGDKPNHERIFMGDRASSTFWFLGRTTGGAPGGVLADSTTTVSTTPRLLLYRYDFKPAAVDMRLWVDPTPGTQPADAAAAVTLLNVLSFVFDYVEVGGADGASSTVLEQLDVDEIRLATTYAEAVPVASPGTLQFSAAGFIAPESAGSATITVSRMGGGLGSVSVLFQTANGTATAGADYTATTSPLTWANGDVAAKNVLVPIAADALAEGSETVLLSLSNPTGGATLGNPATATLTIQDPPVDAWRFAHFGPNANDPAVAGDTAAPAGDGIANLTKYVLGLDPNANASATSALPVAGSIQVSGQTYLTLTFGRDTSVTDATCVIEQSTDLQSWNTGCSYNAAGSVSSTAFTVETARIPAAPGRESITVRDVNPTTSGAQSLLRLRATRP